MQAAVAVQTATSQAVSVVGWVTVLTSTLLAAAVAAIVALIGSVLTNRATERRLQREFQLEFAVEQLVLKLLKREEWEWRSFNIIKHHVGGFEDDELRKILVRVGAIRTTTIGGAEMWSLLERNPDLQPPASEPQP